MYAIADWDYNETYINKTQNFKIRYDWMGAMLEDTFLAVNLQSFTRFT